MSQVLDALEQRLTDVLANGRGADGSLGADAQARSIPVNRFRPADAGGSLTDPQYEAGKADRAFRWTWLSVTDLTGTRNPWDDPQPRRALVRLDVLYLAGAGAEIQPFVSVAAGTGETAAVAAVTATRRALSDAERIWRALGYPLLTRDSPTTDPEIIGVQRAPEGSRAQELPGGRVLCSTVYVVDFQSNSSTTYDP